jgi:hypothetical protein
MENVKFGLAENVAPLHLMNDVFLIVLRLPPYPLCLVLQASFAVAEVDAKTKSGK